MMHALTLGDVAVDVEFKDIKNLHLSVYPPTGRVRIAAPLRMKMDTVRVFALSKLAWIKAQRQKLQDQVRETPREYLDRESHYLWGRRYLLECVEDPKGPSCVELKHRQIVLRVSPGADLAVMEAVAAQWYRTQLKSMVAELLPKWQAVLGVTVDRVFVQQMRTRWGSCNPGSRSVRLNTELAKKPPECAEYVLVHEMLHLLEPTHNARFQALMDRFMPQWRVYRDALNRLPVRHEDWVY